MAIYHNSEYVEQDIDMEAAVPIESVLPQRSADRRVVVRELPAVETMATVIQRGNLWDAGQAITALYTWMGQHAYVSAGPYRELHLFWRELEIETEQFKNVAVEVQVPIAPLAEPR